MTTYNVQYESSAGLHADQVTADEFEVTAKDWLCFFADGATVAVYRNPVSVSKDGSVMGIGDIYLDGGHFDDRVEDIIADAFAELDKQARDAD